MTARVFIDGEAGTTGLQIRARLEGRSDIQILSLPEGSRKDARARRDALNAADVAILCLPDDAAREAVAWVESPNTRIIDSSTAHRTDPHWAYGFPELEFGQRAKIAQAARIANPGCYPTGFLALVRPLIEAGVLPRAWPVTVNAVSGYSGGGRPMIEEFEDETSTRFTRANYRAYALDLEHKHVGEMRFYSGLDQAPVFAPAVGRFRQGMIVEVPLALYALETRPSLEDIHALYRQAYAAENFVEVFPMDGSEPALIDPEAVNGTNRLQIHTRGSGRLGQARLIAVLDNLGKGASGAAVQNLNLVLGLAETTGL
jgi:N-acetyl-gamma-glutamyl-phosphate reductase